MDPTYLPPGPLLQWEPEEAGGREGIRQSLGGQARRGREGRRPRLGGRGQQALQAPGRLAGIVGPQASAARPARVLGVPPSPFLGERVLD